MAASVYLDRTSAFAVLAYPAAVIATPRGNLPGDRRIIESHFAKAAGKAIDHYAVSRESRHCRVLSNYCAMMGTSNRDRGRAAIAPRAGAISTTLVCLKSAELFYEPSGLRPLGEHRWRLRPRLSNVRYTPLINRGSSSAAILLCRT